VNRHVDVREQNSRVTFLEKRKVRFSGTRGEDPCKFLADLEDAAGMMGLTDNEILGILPSVLYKDALEWYRLECAAFFRYTDFTHALVRYYGQINYQERLMEEARSRSQHRDEDIATFITKLRIIFQKFSPPLPLDLQLDIAYANLHPNYALILRFHFNSYEQLCAVGKQVELKALRVRNYRPPPASGNSLVPAAAYSSKSTKTPQQISPERTKKQGGAMRQSAPVSDVPTEPVDAASHRVTDGGMPKRNNFNGNKKGEGSGEAAVKVKTNKNEGKDKGQARGKDDNRGVKDEKHGREGANEGGDSGGSGRKPRRRVGKDFPCLKCGEKGHYYRDCHIKEDVCFRCKTRGVRVADCPNCQSGNGSGDRQ